MRKLLMISMLMAISLIAGARVRLESGSLGCLAGSKTVGMTFNWDQAVYEKAGNLDDFLHLHHRENNWEEVSFREMVQEFNPETLGYGLRMVYMENATDAPYYFVMVTRRIDDEGDIEGRIALRNTATEEVEAVLSFSSDDADDNDEYVFRDQFESIGESLGKLVAKHLKRTISKY